MSRADGSHDMINRVMTKDNIALAALLETKDTIWENGESVCKRCNQQKIYQFTLGIVSSSVLHSIMDRYKVTHIKFLVTKTASSCVCSISR